MTHILTETGWWLLFVQITAGSWFSLSCDILAIWALLDAWRRFF